MYVIEMCLRCGKGQRNRRKASNIRYLLDSQGSGHSFDDMGLEAPPEPQRQGAAVDSCLSARGMNHRHGTGLQ